MRPRDRLRLVLLAGMAAASVAALLRRRPPAPMPWADADGADDESAETPPPVDRDATPTAPRPGSQADRGTGGSVAMDIDRARAHHVEPVVEFLTYVQRQRGEQAHLLFVRPTDLQALADEAEEPLDEFRARLDRLGVVVSHN